MLDLESMKLIPEVGDGVYLKSLGRVGRIIQKKTTEHSSIYGVATSNHEIFHVYEGELVLNQHKLWEMTS